MRQASNAALSAGLQPDESSRITQYPAASAASFDTMLPAFTSFISQYVQMHCHMGNCLNHVFLHGAHRDTEPCRHTFLAHAFNATQYEYLACAFRQFFQGCQQGFYRFPTLQDVDRIIVLTNLMLFLVFFVGIRSVCLPFAKIIPLDVCGCSHQVRFRLLNTAAVTTHGETHQNLLNQILYIRPLAQSFTEISAQCRAILTRQSVKPISFGCRRGWMWSICGHHANIHIQAERFAWLWL